MHVAATHRGVGLDVSGLASCTSSTKRPPGDSAWSKRRRASSLARGVFAIACSSFDTRASVFSSRDAPCSEWALSTFSLPVSIILSTSSRKHQSVRQSVACRPPAAPPPPPPPVPTPPFPNWGGSAPAWYDPAICTIDSASSTSSIKWPLIKPSSCARRSSEGSALSPSGTSSSRRSSKPDTHSDSSGSTGRQPQHARHLFAKAGILAAELTPGKAAGKAAVGSMAAAAGRKHAIRRIAAAAAIFVPPLRRHRGAVRDLGCVRALDVTHARAHVLAHATSLGGPVHIRRLAHTAT
eukprot:362540-Chlamydomonas_euryale.AAC.4